jgi:hypothetical protein
MRVLITRLTALGAALLLCSVGLLANGGPAQADIAAPSVPLNFSAYAIGVGGNVAQLGWRTPSSNGGSPVTGYTVTAFPGGQTAWVDSGEHILFDRGFGVLDYSFLFDGLTIGITYTFTVRARNGAGDGPAATSGPVVVQADFPWGEGQPPPGAGELFQVITPSEGATYALGEQVTLDFDAIDSSAVFALYVLLDGRPVLYSEFDPYDVPSTRLDTSTPGTHTILWAVLDTELRLEGFTRTYCVESCPTSGGDLPPTEIGTSGGTVTTDAAGEGATTEVPVQTAIALPPSGTGGTVSISSGPVSEPAPSGYSFLGNQVTITSTVHGTVEAPLVLTFTLEGTAPGADPAALSVVRTENGQSVTLPMCTGAVGTASPDPCMTSPEAISSGPAAGDVRIVVYTTSASDWNFALHAPYSFNGFFAPVDNRPVVNLTSAGSAIPVKFSLGGNQGLGVFARGYPTSGPISCSSTADIDAIEQTVTANSSGLTYSAGNGQYTYTWKTQKAWAGTCRQLVLKFNDGSVLRANFKLK